MSYYYKENSKKQTVTIIKKYAHLRNDGDEKGSHNKI